LSIMRFPSREVWRCGQNWHCFLLLPNGAVAPPGGPKPIGLEDDQNFSKLPSQDREAHIWFMSQPRKQKALQANAEIVSECISEADVLVKGDSHPLGGKPPVDVDASQTLSTELQTQLLSLSQNSKEMVADKSGHFAMIDRWMSWSTR
jgi:hypothetical protein